VLKVHEHVEKVSAISPIEVAKLVVIAESGILEDIDNLLQDMNMEQLKKVMSFAEKISKGK